MSEPARSTSVLNGRLNRTTGPWALLVVLVGGDSLGGARRWLTVGGFRFQPSEFAKIATLLALAECLSPGRGKIKSFRAFAVTATACFCARESPCSCSITSR